MPNFTLPGHKYVGPGNDIDIGDPEDESDEIAELRDIDYECAKSEDYVFKADKKAIADFGGVFLRDLKNFDFNFSAFLGTSLLSIKNTVEEDILHTTLYPWHPGKDTNMNRSAYALREKLKAKVYYVLRDRNLTGGLSKTEFYRSEKGAY